MPINVGPKTWGVILALSIAAPAGAATVDFVNINDINPLGGFGATTIGTNTLDIDVSGFVAVGDATNMSPADDFQNVFDTISFDIIAPAGQWIKSVSYSEGLKTVITTSGGGAVTLATGSAVIGGKGFSLGAQTFTSDTPDSGAFFTLQIPDVDPVGQPTSLMMSITNQVTAIAFNGGYAEIAKGVLDGDVMKSPRVTVEIVPLPPSVVLFGGAVLALVSLVRRRYSAV